MFLSILIPTYNRRQYVEENCRRLMACIEDNDLVDSVELVVSNNQSPDDTREVLDAIAANARVKLRIIHQPHNIGSVNNVLYLLGAATSEYILFLGDDDFIDDRYLPAVCDALRQRSLAAIIPSILAIGLNGEPTGFGRDLKLPDREYPAGFHNCLANSWRGHQLSGVVFRRDGLAEACRDRGIDNMYLFVFLVAFSCLRGAVLHMTRYPVSVSSPPQSKKEWSYGDDGLLSEMFDNYKRLQGITNWQRFRLEQTILDRQYWRYAMYLKLGVGAFFRCIFAIAGGDNVTRLTKYTFPLLFPFYVAGNVVRLAISGDLMKTFRRPVDL